MTKGTMRRRRIGGGYQKNVTKKSKIGLQWVQSVLIGVQSVKNLHSQHSDLYLHKKGQDEQFYMPVFFVVLGAFSPFVKPSRFSSGCRLHPLHGQGQLPPPSRNPSVHENHDKYSQNGAFCLIYMFFQQASLLLMLCKTKLFFNKLSNLEH